MQENQHNTLQLSFRNEQRRREVRRAMACLSPTSKCLKSTILKNTENDKSSWRFRSFGEHVLPSHEEPSVDQSSRGHLDCIAFSQYTAEYEQRFIRNVFFFFTVNPKWQKKKTCWVLTSTVEKRERQHCECCSSVNAVEKAVMENYLQRHHTIQSCAIYSNRIVTTASSALFHCTAVRTQPWPLTSDKQTTTQTCDCQLSAVSATCLCEHFC